MQASFKRIGLVGRSKQSGLQEVVQQLLSLLEARDLEVVLEDRLGELVAPSDHRLASCDEIGQDADLVIVVGGDGSLLSAARTLAKYDTPVVGVNRGRLGFLTDIIPDEIDQHVPAVLDGEYERESRFLLDADVRRAGPSSFHFLIFAFFQYIFFYAFISSSILFSSCLHSYPFVVCFSASSFLFPY